MKKGRIMCFMAFLLILMLGGCGKADHIEGQPESSTQEEAKDIATAGAAEDQKPEEYVTAVIVTINPQIEIFLDADDMIVGVAYLNNDARDAFSDLEFTGKPIEEGIEQIVTAAAEKEYLSGGTINIEVAEVRDAACDYEAVCERAEAAAVKAAEDNQVEAVVSASVSETALSTEAVTASSTEGIQASTGADSEAQSTPEPTPKPTPEPTPEPTPGPTPEPTPEPTPDPTPAPNPCSNCGGTGKCDECKGDGYRGIGYTVACPRCHGSLTETCIYCDANGNSTKHEGTCDFPNCMGSHVYPCTTCGGGTKSVTCASCGGSGKCKVCGGTGIQ